ncbi:TonB-dependent receptor [Luteimonas suaedae]|uniref:TonB-dependent receptor n=1 Tax=Luteimonas suaedae TaxID=2605430 RepID=UPI0016590548|nr:TonB-dependent receptor [Luteimonas suaedae]
MSFSPSSSPSSGAGRRIVRKRCTVAILLALAAPHLAAAQQREPPQASAGRAVYAFDIPEQELGAALRAFADAAREQVVFDGAVVRGRTSAALSGRHDPDAAVRLLLRGTGLSARRSAAGVLLIEDPAAQPPPPADDDLSTLEDVVVTGTRLRGVNVAAPVIHLDREDFRNAGQNSLEEVFEHLPQNFAEVTPDGRFANEGGSQLRGLNNSRAVAVDLRGLGAQSTLTLVNGTRRAGSIGGRVFDVSTVPLSVIEGVEVVTGGRSAVYGADAVAGVVNLITRRDFSGAETRLGFGAADAGGERLQFSQIAGIDRERGGFVVAYDYGRDRALDLADAGLLSLHNNPEIDMTQLSLNAQADTWRHSGFASGRFSLTDAVELYADALYTRKKFEDRALRYFLGADEDSYTDARNVNDSYSASAGARIGLGDDWLLDVSAGTSVAENANDTELFIDLGGFAFEDASRSDSRSTLSSFTAVADGPLGAFGGIVPRAAFGVEHRRDGYARTVDGETGFDGDRRVNSAFAEVVLPIVRDGDRPGLRQLEMSLAGRYDEYDDFGGTFNPQAGITWAPSANFTLRGAYSTAFRAPALVELQPSTEAFLELVSDPARPGASVPVLFTQGTGATLQPEEAETWSLGFDYLPPFACWLKTSVSYFEVKYDGRIEQPSVNADRELVLERADRYPGLIVFAPGADLAAAALALDEDGFISNETGTAFDPATQDILEVFPDLVLFDNRLGNVAVETMRALDLGLDGAFDTGIGELSLELNLTYTLDHTRRVTARSPAFDLLNEVGKPADTRARARLGWMRGAYGASLYANYVGDYRNPFSTPPSRMGSWTTVDLSLRYDGSAYGDGALAGVSATLSVKNLLDRDPPRFGDSLMGVLYDAANASPFGRYVSLQLARQW